MPMLRQLIDLARTLLTRSSGQQGESDTNSLKSRLIKALEARAALRSDSQYEPQVATDNRVHSNAERHEPDFDVPSKPVPRTTVRNDETDQTPPHGNARRVRELLKDRRMLQSAWVVREVLDKPRSRQRRRLHR